MRIFKYILPILLVLSACNSPYPNSPEGKPDVNMHYDSIYVIADIQWHKQYYPLLDKQVFSIDLLSEGLDYDSTHHIVGTGLNLYISDIFLPLADTVLQEGVYRMDTTAKANTFLPYMYFDGEVSGCYMLDIQESKIQRIIGFTSGKFEITSKGEDIRMNISLYLPDSTEYRAYYQGPAIYR